MSHYYVVNEASSGEKYILAEVVRDETDDDADRAPSPAGDLAGEHSTISTKTELQATSTGDEALRRWGPDDAVFDAETLEHSDDDGSAEPTAKARHLHSVKNDGPN